MDVRKEVKPWPAKQPGGQHHIRREDILQGEKFLKFGYEARAYAAGIIPGKEGRLVMEISSASDGPVEARAARWAFTQVARRLLAELDKAGLRPTRKIRQYVYTFKIWMWGAEP